MTLLDTDTVTFFAYGNLNVKYRIENIDENEALGIGDYSNYPASDRELGRLSY